MDRSPLLLVTGCLCTLLACEAPTPSPDLTAEQDAVHNALVQGVLAFENHDWPAYAALWAKDPGISIVHPGAREWVDGWEAVGKKYRAVISDTSIHITATTFRQDIHVSPSGDVAWVTQQDTLSFAQNGQSQALLQWSTAILEKREGAWKLVHAHASQMPLQQ